MLARIDTRLEGLYDARNNIVQNDVTVIVKSSESAQL